jgi:hypothetical protein
MAGLIDLHRVFAGSVVAEVSTNKRKTRRLSGHRAKQQTRAVKKQSKSAPRVLLTRDDHGAIVCKEYSYLDGKEFVGTSASCDDGSRVEFKVQAIPSWAEFLEIDIKRYSTLKALRSAVTEAADERGIDADIKTMATTKAWLSEPIMDEWLIDWYERTPCTEYAPGFAIFHALSERDRKALQLREGDYGGPASSVPMVYTTVKTEEINRMLQKRKLPYVFVDTDLRWP